MHLRNGNCVNVFTVISSQCRGLIYSLTFYPFLRLWFYYKSDLQVFVGYTKNVNSDKFLARKLKLYYNVLLLYMEQRTKLLEE